MNVFNAITMARASLPHLTLSQRVVDKMVRNASVYETETGESLVGFAIKSLARPEPDLYVLDTIAPDASAIRRGAYFEQGDDLQGDMFTWWYDNWNAFRKQQRDSSNKAKDPLWEAKWDVPLLHLGDWHKHPGTLIEPSWGDRDTARGAIADKIADGESSAQLLAILATIWDRSQDESFSVTEPEETKNHQPRPIKVPIEGNALVRLDCWYMSRRVRRFVRLTPTVVPDNTLPTLAPMGWHLSQLDRLERELALLSGAGYSVSVEQHDADDVPPLEICLALARPNSPRVLILVTQANYPSVRPTIRTAPMAGMKDVAEDGDLFMSLWKRAEPLPENDYPTWEWNEEHTILDVVRDVEAKLIQGSAVK